MVTKKYTTSAACNSRSIDNVLSSGSGTTAVLYKNIEIDVFSHVFNDIFNQYSAMALKLFLVEKCINQGCAKSVNGTSAAFCYL